MKSLLTILIACAAACGSVEEADPCAVPAGGVSVNAGTPAEAADTLNCTGDAVSCSGETRVAKVACVDGFAITMESGNAVLVLRLKGGDAWTAGARLNGADFEGSLSMVGLYAPDSPAPPAGREQQGAFSLHSADAVADGTFSIQW